MSRPNPRVSNGARRRTLRARVIARDDLCWYPPCRQPVDKTLPHGLPGSPEVHELIPVAQGGDPLDPSNCVLTHRLCNQRIGNRTPDQLARDLTGRRRPALSPARTARAW